MMTHFYETEPNSCPYQSLRDARSHSRTKYAGTALEVQKGPSLFLWKPSPEYPFVMSMERSYRVCYEL